MSTRRGMGSKVGVSDEETRGRVQVGRGTNIPSASPNVMKAADIYEEKRLDHISVYPSQSSLYYLDVPSRLRGRPQRAEVSAHASFLVALCCRQTLRATM